jgi:hypothetical protein
VVSIDKETLMRKTHYLNRLWQQRNRLGRILTPLCDLCSQRCEATVGWVVTEHLNEKFPDLSERWGDIRDE